MIALIAAELASSRAKRRSAGDLRHLGALRCTTVPVARREISAGRCLRQRLPSWLPTAGSNSSSVKTSLPARPAAALPASESLDVEDLRCEA